MIKIFPASLETLYEMLLFVRSQAESMGFKSDHISQIELATEEALVNIVHYGYPSKKEGTIEIGCFDSLDNPSELKIIIKDLGIPYNPLASLGEKKRHPIGNDHPPGGYGVLFILKIMDKVEYKRENDTNILILIKHK